MPPGRLRTMLNPPFKRLVSAPAAGPETGRATLRPVGDCCDRSEAGDSALPHGRARLFDLDTNFFCSVIGTCLTTAELRKLMARLDNVQADLQGASDLDIHHDAVRLATQNAGVAKALQKALDHRHAPVVQRASKIHDAAQLIAFWEEALHQGEIPGAYWAVLMHRKASAEMRQRVFGDVHMLSHLVGAANRADVRRLVALERENAELRERLDRQQVRAQDLAEEKDKTFAKLNQALVQSAGVGAASLPQDEAELAARIRQEENERAASLIAVQTGRRERAEQAAVAAVADANRLSEELAHLRQHAIALGRELAAAEAQLKLNAGEAAPSAYLDSQLQGRRVLYVGGRPSSMPAIRDLVQRHGGEFQRHGGRLEDRSGLLASAVSWAEVVVFPVDCIDHESVDNIKRVCVRQQVRYLPLRSAGIGCFAAAFSSPAAQGAEVPESSPDAPICRRNG